MSRSVAQFEQFLRRAHRRYVMLRVSERAGIGILVGSAAALPLLAVALWRGGDALQVATVSLAVGATAGAIWGVLKRPTRLETALEADRQLGWADLLGSAMIIHSKAATDPFAAAVLAAADARCRDTAPSALVFHWLGARAWGGIGLASALVLVLGLFPTFATPTQADQRGGPERSPLALLQPNEPPPAATAPGFSRRTATEEDPDDPNASRMQTPEADRPPSQPDSRNPSENGGSHPPAHASDESSHGTGASQSRSAQSGGLNPDVTGSNARTSNATGVSSGGVGQASSGRGDGTPSGQVAGAGAEQSRAVPPWRSSDWGAKSRAAIDAVESGRIPDSYRDVIRAYFDRP